jgi:hypothetical protein
MRFAVHSASAAVRRTLESIVLQSGHHLAADGASADIILLDTCHPLKKDAQAASSLQLMAQASPDSPENLACPLRPHNLMQCLRILGSTQTIALSHGWALDMQARGISHASATLALTEKECSLLKHLAAAHPAALTREDLLERVWGMAGDIDTHTLETHIYRLRAKLEPLSPSACDILTQDGAYLLALGEKPR